MSSTSAPRSRQSGVGSGRGFDREVVNLEVPLGGMTRVEWSQTWNHNPCFVRASQPIIVTAYRGRGPNRHLLAAHPIPPP